MVCPQRAGRPLRLFCSCRFLPYHFFNTFRYFMPKTANLKEVQVILSKREKCSCELIEILQDIQSAFQYLPEEVLEIVSRELNVPIIEVFRVANFYKAFTLQPKGKHVITVCMGTACHVRGAPKFVDEVLGQLGIKPGETTADGQFTVETVNCLGACALGPVVVLDGKYYDHMTAAKLRKLINEVRSNTTKASKKSKTK